MATAPIYCTHKELKRVYPQIDAFDTKTPIYGWIEVSNSSSVPAVPSVFVVTDIADVDNLCPEVTLKLPFTIPTVALFS